MTERDDFSWDDEGPEFWEQYTFEPADDEPALPVPPSKPLDADRALDTFLWYLAALDPEMATLIRSCVVMTRVPKEERRATVITPSPDMFDVLVANERHISRAGHESGLQGLLLVELDGNRTHQIYI